MRTRGALRLILAIIATLIGIAVLIPVISALTIAGTDDTLSSDDIRVHDGAYALSMDEQIVPFANTTATIHVHGDKKMFLGTANGVDTDSYLTGVAHEEVTDWSAPGSVQTRFIDGEAAPESVPDSRDWWDGKDTGKDLSHTFDLSKAPSVIVVAPASGKGDLDGMTVSVDVKMTGVFAFCLIGIGIVILAWGAAAFFFIRWYRGGPRPGSRKGWLQSGANSRAVPKDTTADGEAVARIAGPTRAAKHPGSHGRIRRAAALAGTGALALTASGCSPLPIAQPQAPRAEGYSKVAMEQGKAGQFMSDYVDSLGKSLKNKGKGLDDLQADPLLTRTSAEVQVAKAQDKKLSAGAFDSVLAGGPAFSGYPLWFMAFATPRGDSDAQQVLLVRRESAAADWKVVQSLFVPSKAVPKLAASSAGAVESAPDSHTKSQDKATDALVDYLGQKPGKTKDASGVKTNGSAFSGFRKYVDGLTAKKGGFKSVKVSCKNADDGKKPLSSMNLATEDEGSASGGVSAGEVSCELSATASRTASVDMGKDVEALISGAKNRSTVKIEFSIPYLLTTSDGAPTVAGNGWFMVGAKTTGKKTQGVAGV